MKSFICFLLLFINLSVQAGTLKKSPPKAQESLPPINLIIDTDLGWDDWLALAYLFSKSKFSGRVINILGISVAGTGEVHLKVGVKNLLGLLELYRAKMTPVLPGSNVTVSGYPHPFPSFIRSSADHMNNQTLPKTDRTAIHTDLPPQQALAEYYSDWIKSVNGTVSYLAIGGFTNLALALREPRFRELLKSRDFEVLSMSGALKVSGNIPPIEKKNKDKWAEWNIYIDPIAAQEVVQSSVDLTMVPLDFTNYMVISKDTLGKMREKYHETGCRDAMKFILDSTLFTNEQTPRLDFFDSSAAYSLYNDNPAKVVKNLPIRIVTDDTEHSGQIVVDAKANNTVRFFLEPENVDAMEEDLIDAFALLGREEACLPL